MPEATSFSDRSTRPGPRLVFRGSTDSFAISAARFKIDSRREGVRRPPSGYRCWIGLFHMSADRSWQARLLRSALVGNRPKWCQEPRLCGIPDDREIGLGLGDGAGDCPPRRGGRRHRPYDGWLAAERAGLRAHGVRPACGVWLMEENGFPVAAAVLGKLRPSPIRHRMRVSAWRFIFRAHWLMRETSRDPASGPSPDRILPSLPGPSTRRVRSALPSPPASWEPRSTSCGSRPCRARVHRACD
jgi:hypothetical protein